jgi:Ca2+-transporting ATPase
MLYGGTLITTGSIIAVITSTGPNTQIGKISAGVEAVNTHSIKTPLGEKLDKFSNQLSRLVGVICICVWLVNIPNFKESGGGSILQGALRQAKVAVALGVAAIPVRYYHYYKSNMFYFYILFIYQYRKDYQQLLLSAYR